MTEDPRQLEDLERTIHRSFARGADMLVAGIMATIVWATTLYCPPKKKRLGKDASPPAGLNVWLGGLFVVPVLD